MRSRMSTDMGVASLDRPWPKVAEAAELPANKMHFMKTVHPGKITRCPFLQAEMEGMELMALLVATVEVVREVQVTGPTASPAD